MKATSADAGATKADLQRVVDPVEKFIFDGIQSRIWKLCELRTVWCTSDEKMQALQRLFGNAVAGPFDQSNITYPYGFLTLNGWEEDNERGNSHYMSRMGFPVVLNDSNNRAFYVKVMPVVFSVKLEYVTNNNRELVKFATLLTHSRRRGWLKFNVSYGRTVFEVSVYPEGNFQIPQRRSSPDEAQEFAFETTLSVKGFISLPVVTEQQVVTKINVTESIAGSVNALPSQQTVFWSFSSPDKVTSPTSTDVTRGP